MYPTSCQQRIIVKSRSHHSVTSTAGDSEGIPGHHSKSRECSGCTAGSTSDRAVVKDNQRSTSKSGHPSLALRKAEIEASPSVYGGFGTPIPPSVMEALFPAAPLAPGTLARRLRGLQFSPTETAQKISRDKTKKARRISRIDPLHDVKVDARKWIAGGWTHEQVCRKLRERSRPVAASWSRLSWPEAYRIDKYRPLVQKWLSKHCKSS